jgi:hypothetical protein
VVNIVIKELDCTESIALEVCSHQLRTINMHYYIKRDIIFLLKKNTATICSYRMARVVLFVAH